MERIEFIKVSGNRWRWVFTDGAEARILSNDVYLDLAEAQAAAHAAYPDLDVDQAERPEDRSG